MWVQHTYSKRGRNTRTQEKERRRWQRRRIFWEGVLKKKIKKKMGVWYLGFRTS
jgi:hypothetical protein